MTITTGLEALKGTGTILLTTYKRDGTPVPTPVSVAFDGDRAFFRSYDQAWKTKRLRNDARVEIAPATLRVLQAVLVPFAHRVMHYQTMHYELERA
jgi:uncharacterized protein